MYNTLQIATINININIITHHIKTCPKHAHCTL